MPLPSDLQRKSPDSLWGFPCIRLFVFLLLPLEFSKFYHFNYAMSWYGSVWVHLVCDPLCFLYLVICFFLQVWEVFSCNFLKYIFIPFLSLFSFWDPYNVNVGTQMLSQKSGRLLSSFFSFVFLSAILIGWFPLFYLLDHLGVLLYHLVCYSFILLCLSLILNYLVLIGSFLYFLV